MNKAIATNIKAAYETVSTPDYLSDFMRETLASGRRRNKSGRVIKAIISTAAVLVVTLVSLLNLSPSFALAAQDVPFIGEICRIFTFRQYSFADEIKTVDVSMPKIENTGNEELENRINLEISKAVEKETALAQERAEQYYDAFIATGGKPEDYIPIDVVVDYEVKCNQGNIVSFVVYKSETLASAYQTSRYYNIDIETGKEVTLKDLLGSNYVELVAGQVEEQFAELNEQTASLLFEDIDLRSLINENRKFYVTEDGKSLKIVFEKYEIAAGAAGQLEFEITF